MLRKILNDEHLKQASQIAVMAFFAAFVIEILRALAFGGEPHFIPYHALVGAGIGSFFFAKFGRKGIIFAVLAATSFNIVWELLESFIGWAQLYGIDTKIDVIAVYLSMLAGMWAEHVRRKISVPQTKAL